MMSFEEFQSQARLYALDALDPEELKAFQSAREHLGPQAEACIREYQDLSAVFALSLRPKPPRQDAKARLLALIRGSRRQDSLTA